jgi:hypothetical protein
VKVTTKHFYQCQASRAACMVANAAVAAMHANMAVCAAKGAFAACAAVGKQVAWVEAQIRNAHAKEFYHHQAQQVARAAADDAFRIADSVRDRMQRQYSAAAAMNAAAAAGHSAASASLAEAAVQFSAARKAARHAAWGAKRCAARSQRKAKSIPGLLRRAAEEKFLSVVNAVLQNSLNAECPDDPRASCPDVIAKVCERSVVLKYNRPIRFIAGADGSQEVLPEDQPVVDQIGEEMLTLLLPFSYSLYYTLSLLLHSLSCTLSHNLSLSRSLSLSLVHPLVHSLVHSHRACDRPATICRGQFRFLQERPSRGSGATPQRAESPRAGPSGGACPLAGRGRAADSTT